MRANRGVSERAGSTIVQDIASNVVQPSQASQVGPVTAFIQFQAVRAQIDTTCASSYSQPSIAQYCMD